LGASGKQHVLAPKDVIPFQQALTGGTQTLLGTISYSEDCI
jgi:hypothetical protein